MGRRKEEGEEGWKDKKAGKEKGEQVKREQRMRTKENEWREGKKGGKTR